MFSILELRSFRNVRFSVSALALAGVATAHAGSLIDTNLPSGTSIITMDAQNDGAHYYNGDQSDWYAPFATNGQLNKVTVGPGTYSFNVIDAIDAHAQYPGLTPNQLSTIGSSWSFNNPYTTSYFVFVSSAATDSTEQQLFAGANRPDGYFGTGEAAYQASKAAGSLGQIYTGPGGRGPNGVVATTFTFAQTTTLIFVVPDYYLPDNHGYESVAIRAVPEPTTVAAMTLGFVGLTLRRRKAKRAK